MGTVTVTSAHKAKFWQTATIVYGFVALSALAYIYMTFQAAELTSSPSSDDIKQFMTHVSFIIPEILVWVLAARAATRMKSYSRTVIGSPDGKAFDFIANALLLLVLYSILLSIATTVKILFINTQYLRAATVITNHLPIVVLLISSVYLYIGSRKLNLLIPVRSQKFHRRILIASVLFLLAIVAAFTLHFYRVAPSITDDDGLSHFAMPAGVMLVTFVLPQAITWFLGMFASMNLAHYATRVDGVIYKGLLRNLYVGIQVVFICIFLAQMVYVMNIKTRQFSPRLLPVFCLLLLLITGYLLIYRGASQLSRLED